MSLALHGAHTTKNDDGDDDDDAKRRNQEACKAKGVFSSGPQTSAGSKGWEVENQDEGDSGGGGDGGDALDDFLHAGGFSEQGGEDVDVRSGSRTSSVGSGSGSPERARKPFNRPNGHR